MAVSEENMQFLEEHIPELADLAIKQAYWSALASGSSVLECIAGAIVEINPNGTRKIIKKVAPSTRVKKGQKLKIP